MKFGKLEPIEDIDDIKFDFGESDPRNKSILKSSPSGKPRVYVGAPIWGVKEWVGLVYPPKTAPHEFLYHYTRQFNTIELNTTHYRIPEEATILKWKESSGPEFRFCPKIPQLISHDHALRAVNPLMKHFSDQVLKLEAHLGLSFIQLPPQFSPLDLPYLKLFLRDFASVLPLAIEFRHPGWFEKRKLISPAYELLSHTQTATVITDVAGRRDVCHSSLTHRKAIIRFVGNELHPTDFVRIDSWVERLKGWFDLGLTELYFIVHQPGDRFVPELAGYLIDELNKNCALEISNWKPQAQPATEEQMNLF